MPQSTSEVITDLETQRDAIIARLAVLELGPSFAIDGVSITSEWAELMGRLKDIIALLEMYRGPTVVHSVGD